MRRHAMTAAGTASAALLLTALAAPAVHAEGGPVITKVVVNQGRNIVVGPTAVTEFTARITATYAQGVSTASVQLWHGDSADDWDGALSYDAPVCAASSGTTTTCTMNFQVKPDPRQMVNTVSNELAGTWHVSAQAVGRDRVVTDVDDYATVKVQRAARLTVNAAPEPVRKGRTLTVTGTLTRANWNTHTYAGYSGRQVALQYRPKAGSTYTTLKTVTTGSTGKLSTTVKATADGYYRYAFAGTSTTPAVSAAGDFVDVN